ncbi:MAG: alpha/beta fold hydrolase [Leptospiraceae bacterium]|nr:alpha/beta fold hydrolase [Leptospiraceae bacterium]
MSSFLLMIVLILNCFAPEGAVHSKSEIKKKFQESNVEPIHKTISFENRNIHFVSTGDIDKNIILFIHGSPGSWDAFIDYLTEPALLKKFHMISYDRPGFGESKQGGHEPSLPKQALVVKKILDEFPQKNIHLVGHSYGGPVLVRLLADYPKKFSTGLILAGSIDPDLEKEEWIQTIGNFKVVRWILPSFLDNTNQEILALKNELVELVPLYDSIHTPVTFYQGEKDTLVPKENAFFAKKMFKKAKFELFLEKDLNHFIPWNRKEKVISMLLKLE